MNTIITILLCITCGMCCLAVTYAEYQKIKAEMYDLQCKLDKNNEKQEQILSNERNIKYRLRKLEKRGDKND